VGLPRRARALVEGEHLWYVDPQADAQTLEVQRWTESGYVIVATHRGGAVVRAEPFQAIELPLAVLWQT
jgi:hypothetical protein